MIRSVLAKAALLGVVGLVPAGVVGYRYWTNRPSYLLDKGRQAVERGDFMEAERLAMVLEQKGDQSAMHLLRGRILLEEGKAKVKRQPATSSEDVQRAVQIVLAGMAVAHQPLVVRGPAWLLACLVQTPSTAPSTLKDACRRALAEFTHIQDDGKVGIDATVLAAECLYVLGQRRLAAEGLEAIAKRAPDNKLAHWWLAQIYIELHSRTQAIEHLREWGRLEPQAGLPFRWIGFFLKDSKKFSDAIEAYREALKRHLSDPVRAEVIQELAETIIQQKEEQEDAEEALVVLAQAPDAQNPEILALRGKCLEQLGRHAEAVKLVDAALQKNPSLAPALLQRAVMYINDSQPQAAVPLLKRALLIDPHDYVSLIQLSTAYEKLMAGKPAKEKERLKKLVVEQQRQAEDTKHLQERLSNLAQEAEQHPWDGRIRYEIAMGCVQLNRLAEARMWLQASLVCNPNNTLVQQSLAVVRGMQGLQRAAASKAIQ